MRSKVFVSYSHKDKKYLDELSSHIKPLVRSGDLDLWDDRRIQAGQEWHKEIQTALNECCAAILLVSHHYLASDYIDQFELPFLLDAVENKGAVVLPVIVSDCRFKQSSLAKFMAVNEPTRPLKKQRPAQRDAIWVKLVDSVEAALLVFRQEIQDQSENEDDRNNPTFDAFKISQENRDVGTNPLTPVKSIEIEFDLDRDFDTFTEQEIHKFIGVIRELLHHCPVKIKGVRRGSVKITLEIPADLSDVVESLGFVKALEMLGVVGITKRISLKTSDDQFGQLIDPLEEQYKKALYQLGSATKNLVQALEILMSPTVKSTKDMFRRNLYTAMLYIAANQPSDAIPILVNLDQQITRHSLNDWEPELALAVWSAMYRCFVFLAKTEDDQTYISQAHEVFEQISRTDPVYALTVKDQ